MTSDIEYTTEVEDADIFARAVMALIERRDDEARTILSTLPKQDPIAAPSFVTSLAVAPQRKASVLASRVYSADITCHMIALSLPLNEFIRTLTTYLPL